MSDFDVNNNNFPDGLPNGNVNRRVPIWDENNIRNRNFGLNKNSFDDFSVAPPRRNGLAPPESMIRV
jgi:hypothetical protein